MRQNLGTKKRVIKISQSLHYYKLFPLIFPNHSKIGLNYFPLFSSNYREIGINYFPLIFALLCQKYFN
jgi:hypothetical protein